MKTTKGWTRAVASAIFALFAFAAANTAQARSNWTGNKTGDLTDKNNYQSDNRTWSIYARSEYLTGNKRTSIWINKDVTSTFKLGDSSENYKGLFFEEGTYEFHTNLGDTSNVVKTFDNSKASDTDKERICVGSTKDGGVPNGGGNASLTMYNIKAKTKYVRIGSTGDTAGTLTLQKNTDYAMELTATETISIRNGSIINNGGTVTAGRFYVGEAAGKTGTLTINSGTVKTTGNYSAIGYAANSTGVVTIGSGATFHNDGQTTNPNLTIGHASGSSGTVNIQGGTMRISGYIALAYNAATAKSDLNVTDGGVLEVGYLYKNENVSGVGTLTVDNGTIKALADNADFISSQYGLEVAVGAGGATFDTDGHDITVNAPVVDASGASGALTITGGGKVTLAGGSTCTGGTTVDFGTVLAFPASAKSALVANGMTVAYTSGIVLDGTTVLEINDGNGTFTQEDVAAMTLTGLDTSRYALVLADGGAKVAISDTLAGEYVWNGGSSADGWRTSGRWSKNGTAGDWYDSTAAVFETAGDAATVDSAVAAASVTFRANATVGGSATLTVPEVSVVSDVAATITAPTAGELTKTGAGTLTLGASRTADATTLSEGTLVMSGSGTTLDWTKLTFGTDVTKPVTLRFTDGATASLSNPVYIPAAGNRSVTLVKDCGDWTASGNFLFPHYAGSSATFIHNGGALTVGNYFTVGDHASATAASLEINGGTVNTTKSGKMTLIGSTCDATAIIRSGGTLNVTGDLLVGANCVGTLTIDDGGTVNVADIVFAYGANGGNSIVDLKQGGNLSVNRIYYSNNSATGVCKFRFDGGTLKCKYTELATAHDRLSFVVASRGGTINVNGKTVTLNEPLLEDAESTGGGMTFKGGGTIALASGNTYTGATTVEVGTTLVVPAPIAGANLVFEIPQELADGFYEVVKVSGENAFASDVVDGKAGFRLSADGKTIFYVKGTVENLWIGGTSGSLAEPSNWLAGEVPGAGQIARFDCATAATLTLPANATFSPSAITFPADCPAVTINGEGEITGIVAVSNLSETVSHTINVPVRFAEDIQVKQAAMAETGDLSKAHVTFAGGAYAAEGYALENGENAAVYSRCIFGKYYLASTAAKPWTVQYQGSSRRICLAKNSELHIPYAGKLTELYIDNGGKVYVENIAIADEGRMSYKNYGEMIVTSIKMTGSGDRSVSYNQGTSTAGVFKFGSVTNSMTGNWFYLSDNPAAAKHVFYIGEGGLNATGNGVFCIGRNYDGNKETIRPWNSDFAISGANDSVKSLVLIRNVEFNTTDENDTGRKITLDAVTRGYGDSPAITVSGKGMLQVNKAAGNTTQPTVTVTGTATLAFKPGASLGSGATTINSGATLALPETGTVAMGGSLTLKDGAKLAFTLAGSADTTLDVSGKTLTLPENGKVTVSLSGTPVPGSKYTLLTGANLADASAFTLADGDKGELSVENGNLVYTAPQFFYIKISENAPEDLPVPWKWMIDNGIADPGDADSVIAAALAESGANGIPVWQSYCLGLDPADATSVVRCAAAEEQPSEPGKIAVAAEGVRVPDGLAGVAVTAYLDVRTAQGQWQLDGTGQAVSSGAVALTATVPDGGPRFFRIRVGLAAASAVE